ncbi:MAG: cytochrome c oxidase subunit 3 [Gemmatimonadales bacterium]|jgi:heme/copper-type cytochrome/quinol oxidase subunit 3|nr:MAG: cytochrome c oxidase subunit 3 [Gemmatimonadales bacterium]
MAEAAAVAHDDHHYTSTGLNSWKVGFWTFIGSECLFFGTLLSTYMVYKGAALQGPYPGDVFDIPLTTISTFVLLMSSLAMVLALDGVQRGNKRLALFWLGVVIVFGSIFLGFQYYEFTHFVHEGLTLQQSVFGSTFFVLTGFHGAHVTVGVIWMISLFVMGLRDKLPPEKALSVEIAGLYWHFVDIVWIVIFVLVYLIP